MNVRKIGEKICCRCCWWQWCSSKGTMERGRKGGAGPAPRIIHPIGCVPTVSDGALTTRLRQVFAPFQFQQIWEPKSDELEQGQFKQAAIIPVSSRAKLSQNKERISSLLSSQPQVSSESIRSSVKQFEAKGHMPANFVPAPSFTFEPITPSFPVKCKNNKDEMETGNPFQRKCAISTFSIHQKVLS